MYLLSRVQRLRCVASTQSRRLLCLLLLRLDSLSANPGQFIMLYDPKQSINKPAPSAEARTDWARGVRGLLTWGIPVAILLATPLMPARSLAVIWPVLLAFMGAACLLNARRCGRIHCYVTGPFSLILAVLALLYGIGMLPLGEHGW